MVRCKLSDLVHIEPKHLVFVNHRLKITNVVHEINSGVPFIFLVANVSNNRRKMPDKMVLGYGTCNQTLLIPLI